MKQLLSAIFLLAIFLLSIIINTSAFVAGHENTVVRYIVRALGEHKSSCYDQFLDCKWSPDGKCLAISYFKQGIFAWNVVTMEASVMPVKSSDNLIDWSEDSKLLFSIGSKPITMQH